MTAITPAPLRALLTGIVDYAGLFPPAGLRMAEAVRNYASHCTDEHHWMLGRFVVPIARLDEFAREFRAMRQEGRDVERPTPWSLSVLGGTDPSADAAALAAFRSGGAQIDGEAAVTIDAVEFRVQRPEEIETAVAAYRALPGRLELYVEIPLAMEPAPFFDAIARAGARAKARTGGVTAELIPPAAQLLRFLDASFRAGVPAKATAGLHHPVRAMYALTYAPDSPRAEMHGYLNLFLAAAVLRAGGALPEAEAVLDERDASAFVVTEDAIRWRDRTFSTATLDDTRSMLAGFGSCSFREPVDDLRALALL